MEKIKTKKTGNSIVLNIGKKLGIPEGKEYIIHKETNGTIILVPVVEDYFADPDLNIEDIDSVAEDFSPLGIEWSDE